VTVHPVPVPRGVGLAEVERLLRRVAAEHGAAVVRRETGTRGPLGVEWHVRTADPDAGVLVVVHAPGRLLVEAHDPLGRWAMPRAGRFATRLADVLDV